MKKTLLIFLFLSISLLSFAEKEVFSYVCEDIYNENYNPEQEGFHINTNSFSAAGFNVDIEIKKPLCLANNYGGWLWEETLNNLSNKYVEIHWEDLTQLKGQCRTISEQHREIAMSLKYDSPSTLFHEIRHAQQPMTIEDGQNVCKYDLLSLLIDTIIKEADAQTYGTLMVNIIGIQKFYNYLEYNKWYKEYDDKNVFSFGNSLIERNDFEKIVDLYSNYFQGMIQDKILFKEPKGNIFKNTDLLFKRKQLASVSSVYACGKMAQVPEMLERMKKYEIFKNYDYHDAENQKEEIDILDIVYPVGKIGEYNYFDLKPGILEDAEKYLYKKIPYYLEKKYDLSWEEIKKTWYFSCDIAEEKITAEDLK